MIKRFFRQVCPPIVYAGLASARDKFANQKSSLNPGNKNPNGFDHQKLDLYWNPTFTQTLESWGEDNAWLEIQFLMVNCRGKVLDVACGTGKVMETLRIFDNLELFGCDISNFLIQIAIARGISANHLMVCDATKTGYPDSYFDYAFSIGSLEHFTEKGILATVSECYRIVKNATFHHLPIARSGINEGWINVQQSYFNNSVGWWLDKFKSSYKTVHVLNSAWQDNISVGRWFICSKD